MKNRIYLFLFVIMAYLAQGCVSVQTFPTIARSGDTITLAVGSPDKMTTANTTIQYVSNTDPGNPVDLTSNIRNIVKIYPDKATPAWYGGNVVSTDMIPYQSGHGPWLYVIVIDLPTSPVMPIGKGHFKVATTASYPYGSKDVNDVDISMEIISGTGEPTTFSFLPYSFSNSPSNGNLGFLESPSHVEISSNYQPVVHSYGAIELKLIVPITSSIGSVADDGIKVIFEDSPTNIDSRRLATWSRNGNEFTLNIISQTGKLEYWESNTSIILSDATYSFAGTPYLESIKYFDIDGNIVIGPEPIVRLVD